MDAIEKEARRAFALAINLYESKLRPDANHVEFSFVAGHYYELRASLNGYTFAGRYDSTHKNSDLFVDVTITEVIHPDDSKTCPHFDYSASKQDLGDNYAHLYDG